jgi:unsaturated rhamnogalacturonyl hydrolase
MEKRMRFWISVLSILFTVFTGCELPQKLTVDPEPVSVAVRVADHFITSRTPKLYYADLLTFYGLLRVAETTGDKDYEGYVDKYIRLFNQTGPTDPITFRNYEMGGIAGAYRFIQGKYPDDPDLFPKHVDLLINDHPRDDMGVFCHPRQEGGKIWVDCLYAVNPFLSMAAVVLDRPELHKESIAQYKDMEAQLYNPELKLFHQVKNFGPEGCTSDDTWGRGNGWALIGLAELIKYLPDGHPQKNVMIDKLQIIMNALVTLQAESGMWRQNLITPTSYEETSGTGLILYAMVMGINEGWLSEDYLPVAVNAWNGLAQQVDEKGAVHNTCVGTRAVCDSGVDYFLNRPTKVDDPHAFGPVLLAAVEMARLE